MVKEKDCWGNDVVESLGEVSSEDWFVNIPHPSKKVPRCATKRKNNYPNICFSTIFLLDSQLVVGGWAMTRPDHLEVFFWSSNLEDKDQGLMNLGSFDILTWIMLSSTIRDGDRVWISSGEPVLGCWAAWVANRFRLKKIFSASISAWVF